MEPSAVLPAGGSGWALVAGIALAGLLMPLNSTMLAVALPQLMHDLREGPTSAGWLITGYLIAMACAQPVAGGIGDRYGRRRVILAGLVGFAVASLAAAAAGNLLMLGVCRLAQAIAGALVVPNSAALVRERIPAAQRGQVLGAMGAAIGVGAAAGPLVGGLITGFADWRGIFLVNVPLVAVALALAVWQLPHDRKGGPSTRFDSAGAALLAVCLASLALLTQQAGSGWSLPVAVAAILVPVCGALLVRAELRHPRPVISPGFFRSRTFTAANAGIALANLAMYSTLLVVPQFLAGRGFNSATVGMVLVPLSVSMVVFAPVGGRLSDRAGRRWPVVVGVGFQAVGSLAVLVLPTTDSLAPLMAGLTVMGIGLGVAQSGLQGAALEAVDVDQAGSAAGVFSTSRYFGSIVGSSLLAALLQANGAGEAGFHAILLLVAATACLGTVATLFIEDWPEAALRPAAQPQG